MAFPKLIFERYRRVADGDPGLVSVGIDFMPLKEDTGRYVIWRIGFRHRRWNAFFRIAVAERTDGGVAGGRIGFDLNLSPRSAQSWPLPKWTGFFSEFRGIAGTAPMTLLEVWKKAAELQGWTWTETPTSNVEGATL